MAWRLPDLRVADRVLNSDAAVVGLQAVHLLRGEFSGLLWGTEYQGVIEPLAAAPFVFALPQHPALALGLSATVGFTLLVLALHALTSRALGALLGAAAVASVAFAPFALHNLSLVPPRIWALALMLSGLAAAERALASTRRAALWATLAGALVALSYFSDLFVALMLPGVCLYALLACVALPSPARLLATLGAVAGFLLGSIPRYLSKMTAGTLSENLSLEGLAANWKLFQTCALHLLGWPGLGVNQGSPVVACVGIAAFCLLSSAGALGVLRRATPALERRLAVCGAGWVVTCVVLFLVSNRAIDVWSSRYLSPALLALPLLLPAALRLSAAPAWPRVAWAAAGLVTLHFAWQGHQSFAKERNEPPALDDAALRSVLAAHHVEAVLAEYWSAYRLSLLWAEQPIVVDTDGSRRKQYLDALPRAKHSAVLFGRLPFPEGNPEDWEAALDRRGLAHARETIGGYQVLTIEGPIAGTPDAHQLELLDSPARLAPNTTGVAKLVAHNTGDFAWRRDAVFVGWHLLSPDGSVLQRDTTRAPLPRDVQPGESVALELPLTSPAKPGAYGVAIDLVKEQVCWFEDRGSKPARFALTVAP